MALSPSVLGPPRPPSIISQERSGHSPGNVLWGSPKLRLMTISIPSQEPHWPVFSRTFGLSQSCRGGRDARLSTVLHLLLQSRWEGELELLEKMKRCRRRRPDSCSLKGRLIRAVRFSSTAQTRYSSAASTPLCRW